MATINHYQRERYPESAIRDFVFQYRRELVQVPALSSREVGQDPYLKDGGKRHGFFGPISLDLLWRFTDEAAAPALAFHHTPTEPDDQCSEPVFHLYSIDPSLEGAWKKEMDRDREIEEEVISYRLLVSNVGWVITERDPRSTNYNEVKKLYDEYVQQGYGQVTLWSSKEDDPIEEHYNPNALDGKR